MTTQMDMDKNMADKTAVDTAVDKAKDATTQAQQKVSETATAAKEQAKRTVTQVGEQAKTTVDSRMSDVAQELGSVADVVRQTSQEVGGDNGQTVARYGERIAEQIEGMSSYLDEHGIEDVLNDVQDFARRQPAIFLGGAFMLGIVIGRFLRSSGARDYGYSYGQGEEYDRYQTGYTSSDYRTTGPGSDLYSGQTGTRYPAGMPQTSTSQQSGASRTSGSTSRKQGTSS
jgi:hypothetical protein